MFNPFLSLLVKSIAWAIAATITVCTISYYWLGTLLRAGLFSLASLLDEATKGATFLLFFHIKSTPESLLLFLFVFLVWGVQEFLPSWTYIQTCWGTLKTFFFLSQIKAEGALFYLVCHSFKDLFFYPWPKRLPGKLIKVKIVEAW